MKMETVRNTFHAQLATVMDSLLAAAVCEIAKIFESSLCEQQAELAHRGEEIQALRGRLERAERRGRKTGEGGEAVGTGSGPARREGGGGGGESSPRHRADSGAAGNSGKLGFGEPDHGQEEGSEGPFRVKEEAEQGRATFKQELKECGPSPGAEEAQAPEGSPAAGPPRPGDALADSRGPKPALSPWEDDPRPQDQGSAIRPALSSAPQRDWLPGLEAGRGGEAGLELLAEGGGYPAPGGGGAGDAEASFYRPGLDEEEEEEEEDEDDPALLFLEQNPEQDLAAAGGEEAGPGSDPGSRGGAQPSSSWRSRERPRRSAAGGRDPLRPHAPNALPPAHKLALGGHAGAGGPRPYTCPYCGKAFTYPSHQRRHLLRHTGVRLHPCSVCDKSFLTASELTVHTRVHTGERPFGCSQCGKRFARSGNLRAHQRDVHMGKRPFGCDECGKRFAHRGNLRVHHHRVHQGAPYFLDPLQDGSPLPANG